MPVKTSIRLRRGTASSWTSTNPVLSAGEPGVESDTGNIKVGDGTTAWSSLSYALSSRYVSTSTLVFNTPMGSINSVSGTFAAVSAIALNPFCRLLDAGSGGEVALFGPLICPSDWSNATAEIICTASAASTGDFFTEFQYARSAASGAASTISTTIWTKTVTPSADSGGNPTWFTITDSTTFPVTAGSWIWPRFRRTPANAADTNTGDLRVHAVVLKKA